MSNKQGDMIFVISNIIYLIFRYFLFLFSFDVYIREPLDTSTHYKHNANYEFISLQMVAVKTNITNKSLPASCNLHVRYQFEGPYNAFHYYLKRLISKCMLYYYQSKSIICNVIVLSLE